jgi:hypothetical protein
VYLNNVDVRMQPIINKHIALVEILGKHVALVSFDAGFLCVHHSFLGHLKIIVLS